MAPVLRVLCAQHRSSCQTVNFRTNFFSSRELRITNAQRKFIILNVLISSSLSLSPSSTFPNASYF